MRLGLLVNGSAGECGVKDQVSYNRVGMKRGGWQGCRPRFIYMQVVNQFSVFHSKQANCMAVAIYRLQNGIEAGYQYNIKGAQCRLLIAHEMSVLALDNEKGWKSDSLT